MWKKNIKQVCGIGDNVVVIFGKQNLPHQSMQIIKKKPKRCWEKLYQLVVCTTVSHMHIL